MQFDVVIAGGGPAGLSAAWAAAQDGARIAVLEKSREIGYPIHTSGASWIDELERLDIPERFMFPITEGVFTTGRETAFFQYAQPPACILDVRGLYQYLGELASEAGAEIFVDTAVTEAIFEDGRLAGVEARRRGRRQTFRAPILIDASGCAAVLARRAGLSRGFTRVGVGAEYDLYAPRWPARRVAFLFGSRFAPCGYAWVFPHHNGRVRLGVGLIRPDTTEDPRTYLDRLLDDATLFDGRLHRASRLEFHVGTIPSEPALRRTVQDGLLVVGDAGGLISTLLGEGIRFAIDIGRMAGRVAAEAVVRGRYDAAFLRRFERAWRRKYGHVFRLGTWINRRLARYSDAQWDRRVRSLAALEPRWVPILLKGELTPKNVTRLLQSHPRFFKQAFLLTLKSKLKIA